MFFGGAVLIELVSSPFNMAKTKAVGSKRKQAVQSPVFEARGGPEAQLQPVPPLGVFPLLFFGCKGCSFNVFFVKGDFLVKGFGQQNLGAICFPNSTG